MTGTSTTDFFALIAAFPAGNGSGRGRRTPALGCGNRQNGLFFLFRGLRLWFIQFFFGYFLFPLALKSVHTVL